MLSIDSNKKAFLLDAYALIYRAYFAFAKNPRINSKGENTSAAFGFTNSLIELLNNEKPSHIAVVFDPPGGSTERQESFVEYKANREEMPEALKGMIAPIKQIIEAFNIPVIEVLGYEADDVIGTMAKQLEKQGFDVYMMTPDKDFGQLVSDKIRIYKPGRGGAPASIMGVKEVCEKFEIENPLQVIDILGMWGDASDNIPGIPGIGEKTAKALIKEYSSLEGLLENTEKLKGKQKENVINYKEQGLLSKRLATIDCNVSFEYSIGALEHKPVNAQKIKEIFTELEFRNLYKRLLGEELTEGKAGTNEEGEQLDLFGKQSLVESMEATSTSGMKNIVSEKARYHLVQTEEELEELIQTLLQQKEFCFDTETTSLEARHADLVGISFSYRPKEAFYIPFNESFEENKKKLERLMPVFTTNKAIKIAHNFKYDLQVLQRHGVDIQGATFDTMVASYLINPEYKQNMDFLAEKLLHYTPISITDLLGPKGKNQKNMRDLAPSEIKDYACEDADITFQLKKILEKEVEKEHLKNLFYKIEMPLVRVLAEMENEGITIDANSLNGYSMELGKELLKLESSIKELAQIDFNVDSPKQLGEVLFDHLKISTKAKKTKTGQYATSEDVLQKHEKDHPIVPELLLFRKYRKLKSTYVDPLPDLQDPLDGRIHTHFMQTVTSTGRLSSNNPNLQNIPIRSEKGREIRKAFTARSEEFTLLAADYSQIELRIMAALSQDENMINAFINNRDIHAETASKVFNVPLEEVDREKRAAAKAVNFGIIYGQSAFGLSQTLNISRKEAKEIIDNYFIQFPRIKAYMDSVVQGAREKGFVETVFKRRRYLPDILSTNAIVRGYAERNAINAPIQGSAADIIKIAMVDVFSKMKELNTKSKLILQVHDELVFDVHKEEAQTMVELVSQSMEHSAKLAVPMKIEYKLSDNWLEAH